VYSDTFSQKGIPINTKIMQLYTTEVQMLLLLQLLRLFLEPFLGTPMSVTLDSALYDDLYNFQVVLIFMNLV